MSEYVCLCTKSIGKLILLLFHARWPFLCAALYNYNLIVILIFIQHNDAAIIILVQDDYFIVI